MCWKYFFQSMSQDDRIIWRFRGKDGAWVLDRLSLKCLRNIQEQTPQRLSWLSVYIFLRGQYPGCYQDIYVCALIVNISLFAFRLWPVTEFYKPYLILWRTWLWETIYKRYSWIICSKSIFFDVQVFMCIKPDHLVLNCHTLVLLN